MLKFREAEEEDALFVDKLARQSPWTRDFANPPMSLKAMRAEAFPGRQVLICVSPGLLSGQVVGFIWCRPMKPKHMPFSTVYYMGVDPKFTRHNIAKNMLRMALDRAKEGRIELVCECGNEEAIAFYEKCLGVPVSSGFVGKDNRPYTRYAFVRGQKGL